MFGNFFPQLNRSINGEDIVKFIKAQRIRWLGHAKRMEVGAMPRKRMEGRLFIRRRKGRLFIRRRKGRLRLRWMDDVVADRKVMKKKQWMEKMKDRQKWRLIVEEVMALPGLQRREEKRK
jgi:hypothetical protein